MSPALGAILAVFLVAYGSVAVFAARRPLLARLAAREALRRKGQSLLVVAGLMVGTATVTAALIAADSVGDSSVNAFAYQNWSYTDITVVSGNRFFPRDVADRLAADQEVRRVTDGVSPGIELVGSAADLSTKQGSSRVTIVGFDPSVQQPFGAFVLTDGRRTFGSDLGPQRVLLSRTLADKLGSRPGDRFRVTLESKDEPQAGEGELQAQVALRVGGIARQEGPGAYTLGAVVFAPLDIVQRLAGTDQINVVRVSVPGGIRDTLDEARRAAPVIRRAVQELGAPVPLAVRDAKAQEVETATEATVFIRALLVGMSALVVAAGAALVVNLIGMLTEERRSRLGVLRALGLKRRPLVGLSVIEGALYSLAAGLVGTAVAVPAGRLVASRFGRAFAEFAGEDFDFRFDFYLKPETLLSGFAIGSFLTLLVVFFASRRTARMSITAAIRNLPEPPPERRRTRAWLRPVQLALLGVVGVLGLLQSNQLTRLIGGLALILMASALLRPRVEARLHATVTGAALAAWSFFIISLADPNRDPELFFSVFVIAMLTSVFGLTILASANLHVAETLVGLLGRAFTRLRAILRPPLAYLARRPLRTGLTTGVFAVIVGMLSLFAVFFVIFGPDYDEFGNGYDVRVLSTGTPVIDIPPEVRPDVARSTVIPTRGYVGPVHSPDGFTSGEHVFVPMFEVESNVAQRPPVRLEQRMRRFRTDREAWEAIARDPRFVIGNFGVPGREVTLEGPRGQVIFTVAGTQSFGLLDGLFGTRTAFAPFRDASLGASMLIDVREGVNARETARAIEAHLFEQGVDAESVQALLDNQDRANKAFFSTIDVLMRMGLVVGILSLGIVAFRIITERRHVIGVMRALGFKRRSVMVGLMAEAALTASIGAVVGIVVGVTMGYLFYRQGDAEGDFGIDFGSIGGVLALIYLAVLLVTLVPAWRASRLPPAEAVRYTE
ncbi:MAG TPA: FtsX-like permease family protein [Actinomycetota bacterium]|nr:FtsX-like permease family protein [Actinomycetota bacterium]